MNTETTGPMTLIQAVIHFSDLTVCHEYMAKLKWPDGVIACPACGCIEVGKIASRRMYQCKSKECRKQFSVKVGTIFEDSALGLDKWFVAVWCITNAKNGISSCELARAIGVTQKSAWHMLHRVRHAMHVGSFDKFTGEVESDECYIGGLARNMHARRRKASGIKGGGGAGKAIVHGVLERGDKSTNKTSRIRAGVITKVSAQTLVPIINDTVQAGSSIYTDTAGAYKASDLSNTFVHQMIDHAVEYVKDRCHTNGLENYWSLLKRTISGTYVSVDAPHLGRYVDEQVFRFNERKTDDAGRFAIVMPGIVGKRLTYKELIGDDTATNVKKDEANGEGLAN